MKDLFLKHQKLVYAVVAAILAYVLLAYVVPGLFSVKIVALAGAVLVGYLVYTRVALWEFKKLFDQGKKIVEDVVKKV